MKWILLVIAVIGALAAGLFLWIAYEDGNGDDSWDKKKKGRK